MEKKGSLDIVVRPKRQVTLPKEMCEQLGINPGDKLELVVEGNRLIALPKKVVALEALHQIRETFQKYGVAEAELQKAGRKVRRELTKERNAKKA